MTLRVLSLFSGAGGADLALEAAGFAVAGLCEIEPHARAVLREHWPTVPLHGDVCDLDGTQYRGVDVVVGGSPCQDLSVAGKRAGLAEGSGTRSSLFFEQVRIWRETGAPYLIWENVDGAFTSQKGADFAAVLSAIVGSPVAVPRNGWRTEGGSGGVVAGRDAVAAWRLLDLQHFGVPQRRERVVVLAARAGGVDPAEVLAVGEGLRGDPAPRFQAREGAAADAVGSADGTGGVNCLTTWAAQGNRVFDAHGVMTTLYAAPGSGQQQQSVVTYDARGNGDGVVANTLAGDYQNRVTDYTALAVDVVLASGQASAEITEGISPTLTNLHEAPITFAPGIPRRLMPIECERLMGWPDDWTRWGVISADDVRTLIAAEEPDLDPTPRGSHDSLGDWSGESPEAVAERIAATQKEIKKLRALLKKAERAGGLYHYELSDTPRYRLCGNGIGREWMEWIAMRLRVAVEALA